MNATRLMIVGLAGLLATCSATANWPTATASEQAAIHLEPGSHLFVDDYLIERSSDLTRTTHRPEKFPAPILTKAESWHQQPLFFQKVIHDSKSGKFRMWYNVKNPGADPHICFCYAESDDGIHWTRPDLDIIPVGGSGKNNIVHAPGCFGLFFVDEGSGCPEPARRYKMAYFDNNEPSGVCLAFSSDGFHFTPYPENPVIAAHAGVPYKRGYVNVISDCIDGCWDPLRERYLLGCKIEEGGYPGKPPHHAAGWRRTVGATTSKDFVTWRRPWQIVRPESGDGLEEFYGFQPAVRGNLYLGFLRVLRDDLPADEGGPVKGIGWTELISSRDGERWTRYKDKFVDRNQEPGTWDHAMAWVGDCVTVGDKDYIYYGGYSAGHKVGDRQLGLAVLRRNGFVSRDAGPRGGTLRTPPVVLDASKLTVNADVAGQLQVRLLDGSGKPIAGFDAEDCRPVQGDMLNHPIEWKKPLGALDPQTVHIEFLMKDTELYGFELSE